MELKMKPLHGMKARQAARQFAIDLAEYDARLAAMSQVERLEHEHREALLASQKIAATMREYPDLREVLRPTFHNRLLASMRATKALRAAR